MCLGTGAAEILVHIISELSLVGIVKLKALRAAVLAAESKTTTTKGEFMRRNPLAGGRLAVGSPQEDPPAQK